MGPQTVRHDWMNNTHTDTREPGLWVLHHHFTSIIPDASMASVDGMRDPLPSQINREWPTKFCEKWLENISIKQKTSPLSIWLFRTVEDGVLQHYPEYLLFQRTESYHQELLHELAVFKELVYGELAFKLFSEVTLEPLPEMKERGKWEVSRPGVLFPDLHFYVFSVLGFLMLKNYFDRDVLCLLQNLNTAEIFQYFNTNSFE